jgi:hypothetical protein
MQIHPDSQSQANQESFVLAMTKNKKFGHYVEIGACFPIVNSNTYVLETKFKWTGLSLELLKSRCEYFNLIRKNKCIEGDARLFNYKKYFIDNNFPKKFDYLQIDIEPAYNTFLALLKFPLINYKPLVITFEHDKYANNVNWIIQILVFCYLSLYGYKRLVKNVCPNSMSESHKEFEDWYVKVKKRDVESYQLLYDKNKF